MLKAAHQALAREEIVSFMSFETSQSVLILVHQGFTGKRPNALHAVVFRKWYKYTHTHTHSHTHTHLLRTVIANSIGIVERIVRAKTLPVHLTGMGR